MEPGFRREPPRRAGRTLRRLAAALLLVVAGSGTAEAYRFFIMGGEDLWSDIASAADAVRWDTGDFPLRFHLQDNIPDFLDEDGWRDIVGDSLAMWSAIRTADIRLSLEPGLAPGDGADSEDGRFTISWVFPEEDRAGGVALLRGKLSTGRASHCDIELNAKVFRERLESGMERPAFLADIRTTVLHEVGHCLGLLHTEPHPVPGWLATADDPAPPIPAGFLPETIMSYGFGQKFELTEDERVAVSLLYPAAGFLASRGVVSGRLVREGKPVSFAYVQAVYPGPNPRMGPGVFSDADGYFHVEGLEPGTVLLWIHPILIHRFNPHGPLLVWAAESGGLDIVDQWQWVRVMRGQIVSLPDIELASGRFP